MKQQRLEALLREHGCRKVREGGDHTIWESPDGATASMPRHNEIKKFTARGICKDLGLDPRKVTN